MATAEELPPEEPRKITLGVIDIERMRNNKRREEAEAAGGSFDSVIDAAAPVEEVAEQPVQESTLRDRIAAGWGRLIHKYVYAPLARRMAKTDMRILVSQFPHRIGHLAAELDMLLKEIELGKRPPIRGYYILPSREPANDALMKIWDQRVRVIRNPLLTRLLAPFVAYPEVTINLTKPFLAYNQASPYPMLLREWADRPPVAPMPFEMVAAGNAALQRWGMRSGGWFVCIHNREPGYSPMDEAIHRHRNASIMNYREAIEEIVSRGGFVVRMGDPTMRPLPEMEGVYDYAHSPERAPELDIFLAGSCRFFVGTTSGLMGVATMFNRPCAMTNAIPYGMAPGVAPRDVTILKLLKDDQGRTFSFRDIFGHGVSRWRSAEEFRNARVQVVQNTPDEIRDLVIEMIQRDEGTFRRSEDDMILQQSFLGQISERDYCYGSGAQMGRAFLRKYAMFI